jgi:hypothetical protein
MAMYEKLNEDSNDESEIGIFDSKQLCKWFAANSSEGMTDALWESVDRTCNGR